MQTSGTAPQFSDGVRKQIVAPVKAAAPKKAPAPSKSGSGHRRGGHADHKRTR